MGRKAKYNFTETQIRRAVERTGGQIRAGARVLDIPESTYRGYLRRFGLEVLARRVRLERALSQIGGDP